jgi:hypothetical protein
MVETPRQSRVGVGHGDRYHKGQDQKAELGSNCSVRDDDSQDDSPPRKRKGLWSCCLPSWSQSRKDPERSQRASGTVVDADVGLRQDFTMDIPDNYAVPQEESCEVDMDVRSSRPPSPDKSLVELEPASPPPSSKFVPAEAPVNGSCKPVPVVVPRLTFNKLPQPELLPRPPNNLGLQVHDDDDDANEPDNNNNNMEPPPLKRGPPDIEPPSSRETSLAPVPEFGAGDQILEEEDEDEHVIVTPRGSKRKPAPKRESGRVSNYLGTPSSALRKSLAREDISSASQRLMGLDEIVDDSNYSDAHSSSNHTGKQKPPTSQKKFFVPNTPPRTRRYDTDEDFILDEPNFPAPLAPPAGGGASGTPSVSGTPSLATIKSNAYLAGGRTSPYTIAGRSSPGGSYASEDVLFSPREIASFDRNLDIRGDFPVLDTVASRKEEPNTSHHHFTNGNFSFGPDTPRGTTPRGETPRGSYRPETPREGYAMHTPRGETPRGGDESIFLPISRTPLASPRQVCEIYIVVILSALCVCVCVVRVSVSVCVCVNECVFIIFCQSLPH